jgi:hypothetical protein
MAVIDTSIQANREYIGLAVVKARLKLEMKGMRHSRGPAATTLARRMGFKGKPAAQLEAIKQRMYELCLAAGEA